MCDQFCVGAPRLHHFCFLCTLKTGTIFICSFEIVQVLVAIYVYFALKGDNSEEATILKNFIELGLTSDEIPGVLFILLLSAQICVLITSAIVIYAACMEKNGHFLLPFLIAKTICVILVIITIINKAFADGLTDKFIWWIIQAAFSVYIIAVVFSYFIVLLGSGLVCDSGIALDQVQI